MGGQLIKGYSLQGDSQGVVGLSKAWKLYRGHKAQTHALSSIFLIEKKQLKKAEKDQTIKFAKKQAGSLLRVRHPGVLAVLQPLTEDENILAFVTERAEGTMSQLIKNGKISQFINSELELKLYLYPFLETIAFIHDSLKQAHLAISPDSIFLAPDGKWKLSGFGINQQLSSDQKLPIQEKLYDYSYSAPQLASGSFTKRSDIFSLGVLTIRLMEFIHKEVKVLSIPDKSSYEKLNGQLRKLVNSSVVNKSTNVGQFQQFLRGILEWQESRRWNVSQLLSSKWLNDSTLITVKYLDKISSYENKQQLQFLKGLAGVLDDFEIRVISRIILPKLLQLLKFGHLIASVVYIIVDLLKKTRITGQLFNKVAWPALKVITQGKEMTAQAIYLFVLNYEILEKYVGDSQSNTFLLPLYIKCFDCPPKLKQLALKNLERLGKKLDYQSLKNRVLPKLLAVLKDPLIDIRKDSLRALFAILKILDSQTISMSVLPAIQAARKAGSDPFINSIINTIYNNLAANLPFQIISSKILPVLIPYLSEPSISKNQFKQFKTTILNMIARVEKERQKTFDNSIAAQQVEFTEADYKFKEDEVKNVPEAKGNYSFLAQYIQVKKEIVNPIQNQPVEQVKQDLSFNIPTNMPRSNETNNQNNFNVPQQLPIYPKVEHKPQPISNPTPSYLPPEVKQPINIPSNSNFPIKLQFPQPTHSNDDDFNFGTPSSNYQPLKMDLDFSALDMQSNNTKLEPVKMAPVLVAPEKKPDVIIKPLVPPTSNLQKKSSNEVKKDVKSFGGTSGPLQIKKIAPIGKPKPVQSPKKQANKQEITPSLNLDYFSNPAPKTNNTDFSLNFDNLGGFGIIGNNQSIGMSFAKKQQQKPLQSNFSFTPPPIKSAIVDPNNPFAQIQSSLPSTPAQSDDIYSYFEDSSKFKGGPSGMDLI